MDFFHGTSSQAAGSLIAGQPNDWFFPACSAMARDALDALMKHSATVYELAEIFDAAGCSNAVAAPLGLQQLVSDYAPSAFNYRGSWITTSFDSAAGYAIRNKAGSEALQFLSEALVALSYLKDPSADLLQQTHSRLATRMDEPQEPVVLRLRNVDRGALRGQDNRQLDADAWLEIETLTAMHEPGFRFTPAFRIPFISVAQVDAVCDLRTWIGTGTLPTADTVSWYDPRRPLR